MISNIDIEDMTDAQDEAPARIRVARDADGFWTCREAVSGSPEYIRSDLARPSQAGDERVARLVEAARRVTWVFPCHNWNETDAMVALDAALAAMDTPKGGWDADLA